MKRHVLRTGSRQARRGGVFVLFLLSLLLLTLTSGAMIRSTLLQRDLGRAGALRTQAEWVFQSAINRAAVHLERDPAWAGEEWSIAAGDLQQPHGALAEIVVTPDPAQEMRRQVSITVNCPPDGAIRARVSRAVVIDLASR